MQRSDTHIRTSHAGTLPPVADDDARFSGATQVGPKPTAGDPAALTKQVAAVVAKQRQIGIDSVGNGEFWNGRGFAYYGQQLAGIVSRELKPGERGSGREATRERDVFPKLYGDMDRVNTIFCVPGEEPRDLRLKTRMVVNGPLKGRTTDGMRREIDVFSAALKAAGGAPEAFICVPGPSWLANFIFDEFYRDEEKFFFALAEAMRAEYRAVTDAGFVLQIDDPGLVTAFDMIKPALSVGDYRRSLRIRVDAVNHAIAGIPEDKVRLHFCWGSWHGAHTHDLPLKDVIDLILQVNAQVCSFEAANVRHEHEWTVWKDIKLPAGRMIMPGVVSHATNLVEHPELIARRITNFADAVGRENVIAGTDCGLGHRVHAELVWAKLAALVEGARLASKALWGKKQALRTTT